MYLLARHDFQPSFTSPLCFSHLFSMPTKTNNNVQSLTLTLALSGRYSAFVKIIFFTKRCSLVLLKLKLFTFVCNENAMLVMLSHFKQDIVFFLLFVQQTACQAPIHWLKYTTLVHLQKKCIHRN